MLLESGLCFHFVNNLKYNWAHPVCHLLILESNWFLELSTQGDDGFFDVCTPTHAHPHYEYWLVVI